MITKKQLETFRVLTTELCGNSSCPDCIFFRRKGLYSEDSSKCRRHCIHMSPLGGIDQESVAQIKEMILEGKSLVEIQNS